EPKLENLPDYFVTALELTPKEHIRVQAAVQRWTDSSISKTANCPNSYTIEQTRELYEYAYKLGCKGVTIYRDGSRDQQVLMVKKEDEKEQSAPAASANGSTGDRAQTITTAAAESHGPSGVAADPATAASAAAGDAGATSSTAGEPAAAAAPQPYVSRWKSRPQKLTGATYEWRSEERRVGKECRSRWSP